MQEKTGRVRKTTHSKNKEQLKSGIGLLHKIAGYLVFLMTITYGHVIAQDNRPPEMVQAGRNSSPYPELVDFESLNGWQLKAPGEMDAKLSLTGESIIYGDYAAQIIVENSVKGKITLSPPNPIIVPPDFDTISLWTRYLPYRYSVGPIINFFVVLEDSQDRTYRAEMECGYFGVWEVLNTRVIAPDGKRYNYEPAEKMTPPVYFKAIEIEFDPAILEPPYAIYLDSLCFFKEKLEPLEFNHTVEDLPKPITEDTILPISKSEVRYEVEEHENYYEFKSNDSDEAIIYRISPKNGNFNDIEIEFNGESFYPCQNGGIVFKFGKEIVQPDNNALQVQKKSVSFKDRTLDTCWHLTYKNHQTEYGIKYQLKNKSLIIDVRTENRDGVEVIFGNAGLSAAKGLSVPYLRYEGQSPQIISYKKLFLSGFVDWWSSDGSELYALTGPTEDNAGIYYNGGVKYRALMDGTYNNISERIFLNVSGDFQEVLPGIPNPNSSYLNEYKHSSWRWLYGGPHNIDWVRQLYDYGIENFMVRFHADAMRNNQQSYGLRDHAAPSIGDEFYRSVGQEIKDMGYGFAVYSNYIHIEGVNKHFDLDVLNRNTLGNTTAKFLCYRIKPLSFLDIHSKMAKEIHERFGTSFSYIDVHAARAPWRDTDCDHRTPMPGMFRLDFLANAQILMNDRIAHNGPTWSEGGMPYLYAGFMDATYGYMGHETPWNKSTDIVDFDLLHLHPRMIMVGMGDLDMYYKQTPYGKPDNRFNPYLDRFIAATIAYGHAAWQVHPSRYTLGGSLKTYFLTNAVQSRYIGVDINNIGYFDGQQIVDTSKAIQTDAYKRRQIYVCYKNGLKIWVNLNHDANDWTVELEGSVFTIPAGGFLAHKPGELLAYSARKNLYKRHEYVKSPEYFYLDGRDEEIEIDGLRLNKGAVVLKPVKQDELIIRALPEFEGLEINTSLLIKMGYENIPERPHLSFQSKDTIETGSVDRNKDGWIIIPCNAELPKIKMLFNE